MMLENFINSSGQKSAAQKIKDGLRAAFFIFDTRHRYGLAVAERS